ncbi:MAG TPA: MFS transporter [Candidatus Limnocylindrales bacterium]|nr:MFS transporter [Candidatus Limnocylindrales bacterium]
MDRSLWAVLAGTFTLRFSTGLTGAMLTYYLAEFDKHHGVLDQLIGLPQSPVPDAFTFGLIAAAFYASELILSPVFGVLSDRRGHWQIMQWGPFFGLVAVIITWATVNVPLILGTRLLEGAATAASIPSILGFIAVATAMDEGLRGKAVARFEAATLAGLLAGFAVAGPLFAVLGTTGFLVNGVLYMVSLSIYRWGVDRNLEPSLQAAHLRVDTGTSGGTDPNPASRPKAPLVDLSRYRAILGRSHVWLLAPTWVAINAVLGLFTTQTIFQLVRTPDPKFSDQLLMGGFRPEQISVGLAVAGLLFFAGLLYWGSRFKNLRRTTIILYGVGGGALLVVAAVGINHSSSLPTAVLLVLGALAVAGLFVLAGATPAAIGLLADVTEAYPEDRGAIMGLYSVFLGLGQIGGSLIAGGAATALGLDGIFVASLVLLVLAVVPLLFLRRHEHYLAGPATVAAID